MSSVIYPKTNILTVKDAPNHNGSITSINNSFLHEGYQSYLESTGTATLVCCYGCKLFGNQQLISVCNCNDKLFHENCMKIWLGQSIDNSASLVKLQGSHQFYQCQQCKYEIRFTADSVTRSRSCSEINHYSRNKKINVAAIIFSIILIVGCAILLVLLALDLILLCSPCTLQKKITMIGLAVAILVLLLIVACCCLDCLRVTETKIQNLYDRQGKSHRSNRSSKSKRGKDTSYMSNSPSPRGKKKPIYVQQME